MATCLPVPAKVAPRKLILRRLLFALWAMAFVPLFAVLHSYVHVPPLSRSLLATAVFVLSMAPAWFCFGHEPRWSLQAWRIVFVVWAVLLLPVLLTVAGGIAQEGWPRERYNRTTAKVLLMVLTLSIPAFLTGLAALLRTYWLTGVLALLTGVVSIVEGFLLRQATDRVKLTGLELSTVLNILAGGAKVESYLAIPGGMVLIVGGIMIFLALLARPTSASG